MLVIMMCVELAISHGHHATASSQVCSRLMKLSLSVCCGECQLDGLIARNFANQTSALGSIIDPLADKLLVSVLYVTLTYVHLLPGMLSNLISFND